MKTFTFSLDGTSIKKCIVEDNKLSVTFRNSGKTYVYDQKSYIDSIGSMFSYLNEKIDLSKFETKVHEAYKKKHEEMEKREGYTVKTGVPGVMLKLYEGDSDMLDYVFSNGIPGYVQFCNSLESTDDYLEDYSDIISGRLQSFSFMQTGKAINSIPDEDYVTIKTGDDTYPIMMFYTKHERNNGYEIWYKAIDPMAWFGVCEKPAADNT